LRFFFKKFFEILKKGHFVKKKKMSIFDFLKIDLKKKYFLTFNPYNTCLTINGNKPVVPFFQQKLFFLKINKNHLGDFLYRIYIGNVPKQKSPKILLRKL
jgi:hypothetical protein